MRHWPPALQAVLSENSGRLGVHLHWCVGNIIVQALHQKIVHEFKEQMHHIMDTQCFFSIQNQPKWFFCGCFMLFLNPTKKNNGDLATPFVLSFSASVGAFGEGLRKPHQVDPSTRPETLGNWKWFVNATINTLCNSEKEECPAGVSGFLFRDCELQARHALFADAKTIFESQFLIPFKNNQWSMLTVYQAMLRKLKSAWFDIQYGSLSFNATGRLISHNPTLNSCHPWS